MQVRMSVLKTLTIFLIASASILAIQRVVAQVPAAGAAAAATETNGAGGQQRSKRQR